MHPYINQSVKSVWRWYRKAEHRHRHDNQCADTSAPSPCPYALVFPANTILPFQVHARPSGGAVTGWKLYNLQGTQIYDLVDHIGELEVTMYADPLRDNICLPVPLYITDVNFPSGKMESVITRADGSYYSETIDVRCGANGENLPNHQMGTVGEPWSYGEWTGLATEAINVAGYPARIGRFNGERVINLADNLLYTWNGSIWNDSTPVNGSMWSLGLGLAWYTYGGGGWASPVTPPLTPGTASCYNGIEGVPLVYTVPENFEPSLVYFNFTIFYGSPFAGKVTVYVNGAEIADVDNANNGVGWEFVLFLEPGDTIAFQPSNSFNGCIQGLSLRYWKDGTDCMTRIVWSNCGDLGTLRYSGTRFENTLYIPEKESLLGDPSPQFKQEAVTDAKGAERRSRTRKEVDWTLDMGNLPWYVLDALTEAALVDDVRLRAVGMEGEDPISNLRFAVDWSNNKCQPEASMTFNVDEASTGNPCCDSFAKLCDSGGTIPGSGFAYLDLDASTTGWELRITTVAGPAETRLAGAGAPGYWSIRRGDGTIETMRSGVEYVIFNDEAESVCVWASDRYGNLDGRATEVATEFAGGINNANWTGLSYLETLNAPDHAAWSSINVDGLLSLLNVIVTGAAFTDTAVDGVIAALNADLADGSLMIDGGTTAAPSGAQDAKEAELVANGWTVVTA